MTTKQIMKEKTCLNCKKRFPINCFYTYTRKKDKYTFYSPRCKNCENINHRNRFDVSPEQRIVILFHASKHNSKRKGFSFSITKEDILEQYKAQNGKCYYSGVPMSPVSGDKNKISIDRKNSDLGYTKENIVLCGWQINIMKRKYSEPEFLQLCETIHKFSTHRTF